MSVVSSITVKGQNYSVVWAANQVNRTRNYLRQDTPRDNIKLQWTKPVIRDSRGRSVSFTARYTVTYGQLGTSNTVTTTTFDSSKYGGSSKRQRVWSSTHQAAVTAVVRIAGVSVNIGTATLMANETNAVPFSQRAKQIYPNDLDSQAVLPGTIETSGTLPVFPFPGYGGDDELSPEFLEANPGFVSVLAQYKLKTESTWKNATTTEFLLSDGTLQESVAYKFGVIIPNPQFNRVYDIRTQINLLTPTVTAAIAANTYQPTWNFFSLMMKGQIDNVVTVGDEYLAAQAMFDSEFPGKDRSKFTFANMITPVLDNHINGTNTSSNEFSKDTTTTTFHRPRATSADIGALIRAIPAQPRNKNTLLVVHVGVHNLLKVSPSRMVSTATFKSSLKSAVLGFLAKNPNAEVRIMEIPSVFKTGLTFEEQDIVQTIEENEEYAQAWVNNAPNYFGTQVPLVNTDNTNIAAANSRLYSYNNAISQIATELSTADNKRVSVSRMSLFRLPSVQVMALEDADGGIGFSPSKFYPSATTMKSVLSEIKYSDQFYFGNFQRIYFTDRTYEERNN
jgi:hypothetical protein